MSLTFVSSATAPAGSSFHVSVYSAGVLQDPNTSTITWSGVPSSVTVTPDPAGGAGGFTFESQIVVGALSVSAHDGVAAGSLIISFTAPPLQFTSP